MNRKKVAEELESIARDLIVNGDDEWLDQEDVQLICPTCAKVMKRKGFKRIKASLVRKALGRGFGPGGMGLGPGGTCVCPECGDEVEHQAGVACVESNCPSCDSKMIRKA